MNTLQRGMDQDQSAKRARRILFLVVLLCMSLSAALIFKAVVNALKSSSPATKDHPTQIGSRMLDDKTIFATYGGSKSCRDCHAKEFAEWAGSHHALAERAVDPAQDRSAFETPRTIQHGSQSSEV